MDILVSIMGLLLLRVAFGMWGLPRLGLLEWICIVLQAEGMTIFALDMEILNSPLKNGMGAWLTLTWWVPRIRRAVRFARRIRASHVAAA